MYILHIFLYMAEVFDVKQICLFLLKPDFVIENIAFNIWILIGKKFFEQRI